MALDSDWLRKEGVSGGVLGQTDQDRREDFAHGYDFRDAFVRPFESTALPKFPGRVRLDEPED